MTLKKNISRKICKIKRLKRVKEIKVEESVEDPLTVQKAGYDNLEYVFGYDKIYNEDFKVKSNEEIYHI